MRSLHLDAGREMRGGQWQVLRLLIGLVVRSHRVVLLARPGSPLFEAASREQLKVQPLTLHNLWRATADCDLIHAHDARTHTLALLTRKPLVVSRRVSFAVRTSLSSRLKYRMVTRFAAVSEHVASCLIAAGLPANRIDVVHDGVPLLRIIPPDGRRVVVPQSDDPAKGTAAACRAVEAAGFTVSLSANLERDLPGASAFVYLSEAEGLGSAILLAMSAGVPVIASDLPAIREMIEPGVSGLLVPNNHEAVLTAVTSVMGNAQLRERLCGAARRTVEARFTEDCMVSATLDVYRKAAPQAFHV